jgi:hypothetical protein
MAGLRYHNFTLKRIKKNYSESLHDSFQPAHSDISQVIIALCIFKCLSRYITGSKGRTDDSFLWRGRLAFVGHRPAPSDRLRE